MDALVDFLLNFYGPTPYFLVFGVLLLCGFGLPIPEDITLIAGGLLAYYGICNLWVMIAVGLVGVMLGDSIMFFLGLKYGRKIMKKRFFQSLIPEDRLKLASERFNKKGSKRILFFARFMPGLRAPMFFSAGLLHVPFWKFFLMDGLAALISVPAIVGAIYYFGDQIDLVIRWIKKVEHGIIFVAFAVVLLGVAKWWWAHRKTKTPKKKKAT